MSCRRPAICDEAEKTDFRAFARLGQHGAGRLNGFASDLISASMKTTERAEYYIACACCMRTTTWRGGRLIDQGTVAWLGEDDKGEPCNKIDKREAKQFRSKAEAEEWAKTSNRKPWWFEFQPGSLKIYLVRRTVLEEEV